MADELTGLVSEVTGHRRRPPVQSRKCSPAGRAAVVLCFCFVAMSSHQWPHYTFNYKNILSITFIHFEEYDRRDSGDPVCYISLYVVYAGVVAACGENIQALW